MTNPRPYVESDGRAPSTTFQAISPTRTTAPRAAAGDTLQERVAETNPPPREGAAGCLTGRVERAHDPTRFSLTSGSSRSSSPRRTTELGIGWKTQLRLELWPFVPTAQKRNFLELGRLRRRRRDDHVGVGRDRVGERATSSAGSTIESSFVRRVRFGRSSRPRGCPSRPGRRELARAVLHREEVEVVLERVRDVDVADRARRLAETAAATPALPRAADARRPVDGRAGADLRLPRGLTLER